MWLAEYRERIAAGDNIATAVRRMKRTFAKSLELSDERWTVWIALAATQLRVGQVAREVRQRALQGIAWCEDPRRDPGLYPFSSQTLARLRKRLGGRVPRIAKKSRPRASLWKKGDVIAVKLPHTIREAVVIVVGPVGKGRPAACVRIVLLLDLTARRSTRESVWRSLVGWRHYRQVWPNGLGRWLASYDVTGSLPRESHACFSATSHSQSHSSGAWNRELRAGLRPSVHPRI